MGFQTGSTYDYATLRAFRPFSHKSDVARRAVKPRKRFFGAR